MPKFLFTAKSQKGESYSGTREAKDEQELARILRKEGYVLISAIAEGGVSRGKVELVEWCLNMLPFFGKVSLKEKIIFTRNFQVMIGAGIALPQALKTLALQSKSRKLKKTLLKIAEGVIKGKTFSTLLTSYPSIFSELFCSMVRVGEESGSLEENLVILTRQMEREYELKSKIRGALVYPSVIVMAMVGIGVMMLIVVVPKLAATFEELGIELPLTTKLVIFVGTFLAEKWYLALLILIFLIFACQFIFKVKGFKKITDNLFLKIPLISSIIKQTNSAYTVRTLASLISAGVSLVEALEIIAATTDNVYFKQPITEAIERVKRGEKLSASLKLYQSIYPSSVIQMIEVGEETGKTSEILQKLGDFFEDEVTRLTKNLTAVIEPVLMLFIGGVIGFFAVSMIQPMYSMLSAIE